MSTIVKTVCQLCSTTYGTCGMDVYLEGDKIVKIEGTKGDLLTNDGKLCAKGLAAVQLEYDSNRLLYPMKRLGKRGEGKWERITWDEALDVITTKLKAIISTDGPKAIAFVKGQAGAWLSNWDYVQRFMNAIGSPNIVNCSHNCHVARLISHVNTYGGMPDSDFDNTNCMVLWGYNPVNTALPTFTRRIMKAKQRGAKLIVIDPRFSQTAAKADIYVRPRPCTDGALALGMLNVIISENLYDKEFVDKWTYGFDRLSEFVKQYPPKKVAEITWVPEDTIREVARVYATTKPAVLHEQNGIDQQPNVAQTTRSIAILRSITGNLDVPGGHVFNPEAPPFRRTPDMSLRKRAPEDLKKAFGESVSDTVLMFNSDYCNIPQMVDAVLTEKPYPIKALIIQGTNLAVTASDAGRVRKALNKVDLLVAHDTFLSASAEMADIVLPSTNFLESAIMLKYLQPRPKLDALYYQLAPKVVEPPGECRSPYDFLAELSRRMGHEEAFPWEGVEEAIDYELAPIGLSYKYLVEHPEPVCERKYSPQELYRKYDRLFAAPFLTDKKVALYSEAFERLGYDPLPVYKEPGESPISRPDLAKEYPLVAMASLKPGLYTHSQFRTLPWLREIMPEPWIEIHPDTAGVLGIKDGDMVVVESPRGSIEIRSRVISTMDPRVVAITHGWGDPNAGTHPVTNLLTPSDIRCPITGAESNRCFLVKVTKKK